MTLNVAIVGTGPTGIYTLQHLIRSETPLHITLYEAADMAGVGMPYHPGATHAAMLANIASIEIPPVTEPYLDWLRGQPPVFLTVLGVDAAAVTERSFLPRLLLGSYFRDGFLALVEDGLARGHRIAVLATTRVADVVPQAEGVMVSAEGTGGDIRHLHDHVVIATGHVWPRRHRRPGHYTSPWTGLLDAEIPAGRIGILGTSLSGIDAAVAVAVQHGRFATGADGTVAYLPAAPGVLPQITLMSRAGLLPEADFWCPLPYEPLAHLTPVIATEEAELGQAGLLDRLFAHFCRELAEADPAYARRIGLSALTPDTVADAYFAERRRTDPFQWARDNLAEVTRNAEARRTVSWRYAILRMHEVFDRIAPEFDADDRDRFDAGLKRVFIDNYAAVPPESVRRILALRDAGVLRVLALGNDYATEPRQGAPGQRVVTGGQTHDFDVFIDARGQRALTLADLPFAGLRAACGVDEAAETPDDSDEDILTKGGFDLPLDHVTSGRVHLAAIPFLMRRRPFVQGITAAAEIGEAVAASILSDVQRQHEMLAPQVAAL